MKKYKVGDKVTIKSLDWYNENKIGDVVDVPGHFIKEMSEHCGKTTIITEVLSTENRYHVQCDSDYWTWSAEMFEEDTTMERKYKKGDKVLLKSQEWYDNHEKDSDGFIRSEPGASFNPKMCKYLGKIATIEDTGYSIDLDSGYWCWEDYMIEGKVGEVDRKSFDVGDFVQIKSSEWFEENTDEDGEIEEKGIHFEQACCGKKGKIVEYDSFDESYRVQFDPEDESNYDWFMANWMNLTEEPNDWDEESEDDEESDVNMPIKGDWVMVADKYSEEGPREDWTIAKFVEARSKGIDTKEGIWNYCVDFDNFNPEFWNDTLEQIYKGENRKLIKVNKDE